MFIVGKVEQQFNGPTVTLKVKLGQLKLDSCLFALNETGLQF